MTVPRRFRARDDAKRTTRYRLRTVCERRPRRPSRPSLSRPPRSHDPGEGAKRSAPFHHDELPHPLTEEGSVEPRDPRQHRPHLRARAGRPTLFRRPSSPRVAPEALPEPLAELRLGRELDPGEKLGGFPTEESREQEAGPAVFLRKHLAVAVRDRQESALEVVRVHARGVAVGGALEEASPVRAGAAAPEASSSRRRVTVPHGTPRNRRPSALHPVTQCQSQGGASTQSPPAAARSSPRVTARSPVPSCPRPPKTMAKSSPADHGSCASREGRVPRSSTTQRRTTWFPGAGLESVPSRGRARGRASRDRLDASINRRFCSI